MPPPSPAARRRSRRRRPLRRLLCGAPVAAVRAASDARSGADQSIPRERSERQGAAACRARSISDLVTYFPQRREEGLRDGTLRELFQEEIKKSHEEYVDQVGREFAESTTHFQDALERNSRRRPEDVLDDAPRSRLVAWTTCDRRARLS